MQKTQQLLETKKSIKSKATILGFFNQARPYPHMVKAQNALTPSLIRKSRDRAASATTGGQRTKALYQSQKLVFQKPSYENIEAPSEECTLVPSQKLIQRPFSSTGRRPFSSIGKRAKANTSALSALKRASMKNVRSGQNSMLKFVMENKNDYDSTLMSTQIPQTHTGQQTSSGHLRIGDMDNFMLACSDAVTEERQFRRLDVNNAQ